MRLHESERALFIEQACDGDTELLQHVRALLAHDRTDDVEPCLHAARDLLERLDERSLDLAPDAIDGYRILGVLGHGGSSLVLRALQHGTGREVAIKLMHLGSSDEQLSRRLALEAHLLGMLDHPGIARILESGEYQTRAGPQPFLAMELVHGKPLTDFCRLHDLGTRDRIALLARVADAVQHAHQCGVLHRDLKPSNILVTEERQPKVLDFGIGRTLHASGGLTPTGAETPVLGTLGYMSPEQLTAEGRRVDMRSDVYTLGVLAYELLAKRAPFETRGSDVPEVLRRLAGSDPVPLGQVDPRWRGDLEAVVCKAMARDRTKRYGSAADFAKDLRRHLAHQTVSARRPHLALRAVRGLRRHPIGAVSIAGLILALAVGLAIKQAAIVENARELARFERLFEDLTVFLNDPHVDADGELVTLDTGTLREKLGNANDYIERRLGEQPDTAGSFHVLIARLLKGHSTGADDAREIRSHFERGAALLASSLGADHPSALQAKRDLVSHLVDRWDLDAAERALAELHRDGADLLDDDVSLSLQLSSIQARLFRIRGQKRAARAQLERALQRSHDELGAASTQSVNTLVRLVALLPPDEGLARIAAQRRELPDPLRPRLALRLDRAEAQLRLKRGEQLGLLAEVDRARQMFVEHRAMCVEQLGASSRAVFAAEVLLASAHLATGDQAAALTQLKRSELNAPSRLAPDDPLLQRTLIFKARALREAGQVRSAFDVCSQLLSGFEDHSRAPTVGDGEALLESARCALLLGEIGRAQAFLARARGLWAPKMDNDHDLWHELQQLERVAHRPPTG
ncbi:MAG: hypothetical protein DHS20C15_27180 [Planctomycetota bacterium]|nr:MAG: hypothetical protein DHS20C15_27180 [Planctomycetota bacterium]